MWRNSSHVFCAQNPLYICGENFHTKPFVYTVHTAFEFITKMGALINLVHQHPALWDKQDTKYKDSNYKEAK